MRTIAKTALDHLWMLICKEYLVLFFIISTGLKLYLLNTYMLTVTYPTNQYISGIVVGFISVAIIFSPLFFINKHKNKIAVIVALIISTLLLIDTIYCAYFKTLPTVGVISNIGNTSSIGAAILGLIQLKYVLFFADIAAVVLMRNKLRNFFDARKDRLSHIKLSKRHPFILTIAIIIGFWFAVQPMGGFAKINGMIENGYDTVYASQFYGIIMAHAIDLTRFVKEETTSLSHDQSQQLSAWVDNNKPEQAGGDFTGIAKGKNIIVIQVESLGGFVIDQSIDGQVITPNLNELADTSQFYPNSRFMIGAGHSSDTDFVVNTSYFPLPDAAVFVRYGRDDFTSLPKALIGSGYSAYAYHGFNRNFWNRDTALRSLGYQKFYAADNYPDGRTLNMGLNDGDFLSATADYIIEQPKPSFSFVVTLSSHVGFEITDLTNNLGLVASEYPEQVAGYLENINYTDRMLGEFFNKLRTAGLYDDSLIVVYGDHTPVLPAFSAGTINYDPSSVQEKEIPLFIKLPNKNTSDVYTNKGTTLDVMPTILDLVGVKTSQLMFGQSLFANDKNSLDVCVDQLTAFNGKSNCQEMLAEEKASSEMIIKYNQFNNISTPRG